MPDRPIRIAGGRPGIDRSPQPLPPTEAPKRETIREQHTANVQELDREGQVKFKIETNPEEKADLAWLNTTELENYIDSLITKFFTPKPDSNWHDSLGVETSYMGNYQSATRDFGYLLDSEAIGDDKESFFKKYTRKRYHPNGSLRKTTPTRYYDMQKKLPRGARQGDFHSIGFISIPHPDNRMKGYFIGLDLTHHVTATNPKARVLVVHGTYVFDE